MASDWIKWVKGLSKRREVIAISSTLKVSRREAAAMCMEAWEWADENTVDGVAHGVSEVALDEAISVENFGKTLQKVGWLKVKKGRISFPNLDRHNSKSAKHRALDAHRKSASEAEKKRNESAEFGETGEKNGEKPGENSGVFSEKPGEKSSEFGENAERENAKSMSDDALRGLSNAEKKRRKTGPEKTETENRTETETDSGEDIPPTPLSGDNGQPATDRKGRLRSGAGAGLEDRSRVLSQIAEKASVPPSLIATPAGVDMLIDHVGGDKSFRTAVANHLTRDRQALPIVLDAIAAMLLSRKPVPNPGGFIRNTMRRKGVEL